ncbi:DUF551 domain-containing protein [Flavobacterium sp. GSP14]|uniref:DUF551 domain-containing protein n=1 Tax=Flavobacterium sp. GSP14 TaxID=3401734 RepID=UPI003AAF5E8D
MSNKRKIKWISVDKKNPENGINVLTYGPQYDGGIGIVMNSYSDGIFRFLESEKENKFPITHWAYLPDVPDADA